MCLCGMLAAEYETLPQAMRDAVLRFFDDNEALAAARDREGPRERTLSFDGATEDGAQAIVGGLEGAMLVARPSATSAALRDHGDTG